MLLRATKESLIRHFVAAFEIFETPLVATREDEGQNDSSHIRRSGIVLVAFMNGLNQTDAHPVKPNGSTPNRTN